MKIIHISDLKHCIDLSKQEQERFNSALERAEKFKLPGSKIVSIASTNYVYTGAITDERTRTGGHKIDHQKLKKQIVDLGWKFEEFFAVVDGIGRICLITNGDESVDLLVLGW